MKEAPRGCYQSKFARVAPYPPSSQLERYGLDSICSEALRQTWYRKIAIALVRLETLTGADYCKGWRFSDLLSECFVAMLVDCNQVKFEGIASSFIIQRSKRISFRFGSSALCLVVALQASYSDSIIR